MEFKVSLTEECSRCKGTGTFYMDEEFPRHTCEQCYGMGDVPSYDGEELLGFIRRFTEEKKEHREAYYRKYGEDDG